MFSRRRDECHLYFRECRCRCQTPFFGHVSLPRTTMRPPPTGVVSPAGGRGGGSNASVKLHAFSLRAPHQKLRVRVSFSISPCRPRYLPDPSMMLHSTAYWSQWWTHKAGMDFKHFCSHLGSRIRVHAVAQASLSFAALANWWVPFWRWH